MSNYRILDLHDLAKELAVCKALGRSDGAREYEKLRDKGWGASDALHIARTMVDFDEMEEEGLVKIEFEIDECVYDDSYLEIRGWSKKRVENEKKRLWEQIERHGVYGIVGYYRGSTNDAWRVGYSIWGIIGDDLVDNSYLHTIRCETLVRLDEALTREDSLARL